MKGNSVLFSGVPCQVNALKTYLKTKAISSEKLYTIDIVCHGCPNPTIWKQHLEIIQKKHKNAKIKYITFRKKEEHGNSQALFIEFENGKSYFARSGHDLYYRMFLQNYILRPSCYACRFSSINREGDLSLADWRDVHRILPELTSDNMGASQVMINTEKGLKLFKEIEGEYFGQEIKLEDGMQPNLIHPSEYPLKFDLFQKEFKKESFERAAWLVASKKGKLQIILQKLKLNEVLYRVKH